MRQYVICVNKEASSEKIADVLSQLHQDYLITNSTEQIPFCKADIRLADQEETHCP
jgi:hypothetical protein